ncbi:MAG: dockerin type I repeat-containing protein [Oscillospiraceae bacterium]|nr:dockerin type I repeat-containing protein [Oscillospiraceae bacterium]
MKKLKKRKLALATAVATLTASLSVFSGVPASATVVVDDFMAVYDRLDEVVDLTKVSREEVTLELDFVVVSVNPSKGRAWLMNPGFLPAGHSHILSQSDAPEYGSEDYTKLLLTYGIWQIDYNMLTPVAEQLNQGDIIHYHGESGGLLTLDGHYLRLNGYDYGYETNDTFTITGSVFDTPLETIKPYTEDDQTALQVTLQDGTEVIVKDWYNFEVREELSAWMLPNENDEFYRNMQTSPETVKNEISKPEGTWYSHKMVVVDMTDDAVYVAWEGEAHANDKRGMTYNFYKLDKSIPEMAKIAGNLKYGDVIRYTGTGEMVFAGNPLIDDMSFTSGEGKLEILGSVVTAPVQGNFTAVTDKDNVTYILMNDADYDTCYMIESRADHNTIADFLAWVSEDHTNDSKPHKFDWKKDGAFWIRPNEDGDVNSDNEVNSADAAVILEDIALSAVGDTGRMNASENQAADVNGDGAINAADAAIVLSYSSEVGSGMLEGVTLKAYAAQ